MASLVLRGDKYSIRFYLDGKYKRLTNPDWNVNKVSKRYMLSIKDEEVRHYCEQYYTNKKITKEHDEKYKGCMHVNECRT